MKPTLIILTVFIFLSVNILASCEEGQIDINTASAEELDEIVYIGSARAEQIIALRPFDSVDDMIRISGIGEVYLNAIKQQGLACVNGVEEDEKSEEEKKEVIEKPPETKSVSKEIENVELQMINLNPQVIKSDDNKEGISKNYALYGFGVFCILIGILFIIKNRRDKNEFR